MKFAANLNLKEHQFFFTHPVLLIVTVREGWVPLLLTTSPQGTALQKMDSAIHWIVIFSTEADEFA